MIKKEFYTSPEVDVFTLQFEGVICGSEYGSEGAAGGGLDLDDDNFNFGGF